MTFVFNNVSLSALNSTSPYYIQMVISVPSSSLTTVSDISSLKISTIQYLTGASYSGGVLTFPNQTFNTRTFVTSHTGFVLIKQLGSSPSSSDELVCYAPHTNSFNTEIILPVGTYAIPLIFQSGGLLTVTSAYQYTIGAYISTGSPFFDSGMVQLIGTENNTVPYINPHNRTPKNIESFTGSAAFNRDTSNQITPPAPANMFRFRGGADIKFNSGGQLGVLGGSFSPSISYKLWGSNTLSQGWTNTTLIDANNWTELASLPYVAGNDINVFTTPFSTLGYYKYLRISTDNATTPNNSTYISNIDFYGCTVRTPYQNFS